MLRLDLEFIGHPKGRMSRRFWNCCRSRIFGHLTSRSSRVHGAIGLSKLQVQRVINTYTGEVQNLFVWRSDFRTWRPWVRIIPPLVNFPLDSPLLTEAPVLKNDVYFRFINERGKKDKDKSKITLKVQLEKIGCPSAKGMAKRFSQCGFTENIRSVYTMESSVSLGMTISFGIENEQ